MNISTFSVKNYQFTIVVFLLLLGLGITALFTMPRGEDPPFNAPLFVITAVYPGTSPADMEKLVVDPIEEKLNELNELKRIRTTIDDGLMVCQVEFVWGSNIDNKYNEVVREVNAIRDKLPADILSLDVLKITSSDVNTYQLALVSDSAEYSEMEIHAERLKKNLEKIKTIKKVKVHALPDQEVRVAVDLGKMAKYKIPLNRVLGAIQSEAANIPGGSIDAGGVQFNVKSSGDYTDLEDIRKTVVLSDAGKVVYLSDIAKVSMTEETQSYRGRYNGKRAIFISVSEKEKTNILSTYDEVMPIISESQKSLPTGMKLEAGFVQAEDVDHRLGGFSRDITIAIILVLITLLPLGTRASIVVMISIPLSIAIGLMTLNLLGYTINQLSIVGLVIALGLLVDDSIVVVENIERFMRNGYSRYDAAIEATKQISLAVLGCTATLIIAFLPILFLPEGSGDFIRSLPMAVITTVLASLLVSLTIVPFLSSKILKSHANPEGNIFLRGLQKLISGSYRQLLHHSLARPWLTIVLAIAFFAGSVALFPIVGFSLFPKSEKPMFMVNIEAPLGTGLNATDSLAKQVEKTIMAEEGVKAVYANIGKGNPRVYYNIVQKNESSSFAQMFVRLERMELPEIEAIVERLRGKFAQVAGARIEVKQFEQGPPIEAPIAIRVFGENLDTLRTISRKITGLMKKTEGTIYIDNPLETYKTDIRVKINRDKAAIYGISTVEIDRSIRMGLAGLSAAIYKDKNGDDYQINVTLDRDIRPNLNLFNQLYISSATGALIPIKQLATLDFETTVPIIGHYNKNRYVTVTSFVKSGYNTMEVTNDLLGQIDEIDLPAGFSYQAAGEVETSKESFGGLGTIILITIFGFLGVLLLEFGTFKSTMIVLSVIPLGIIGAVLILLITGNTLSFVAVVGMIALAGIEVKNSILLVDYTNYLRKEGKSLDDAIQEAGETRFLPIILTTFTAIGGLIPLVLENSPLYSPLAWVLIGGLLSSTILTRLVTPVVYKLLAPKVI